MRTMILSEVAMPCAKPQACTGNKISTASVDVTANAPPLVSRRCDYLMTWHSGLLSLVDRHNPTTIEQNIEF